MYYYYILLLIMVIGAIVFAMTKRDKYYLIIPYIMTIAPSWFLMYEKLPSYGDRLGIAVLLTIMLVCFRIVFKLK